MRENRTQAHMTHDTNNIRCAVKVSFHKRGVVLKVKEVLESVCACKEERALNAIDLLLLAVCIRHVLNLCGDGCADLLRACD